MAECFALMGDMGWMMGMMMLGGMVFTIALITLIVVAIMRLLSPDGRRDGNLAL